MKFVTMHVHTSGLSPASCEILELSYQTWENGKRGPMSNDTFRACGDTTTSAFLSALPHNGYNVEAGLKAPPLQAGFVKRFLDEVNAADGSVIDTAFARTGFGWRFIEVAAARLDVALPAFVRLIDIPSLAMPMLGAGKVGGLSMRDLTAVTGKPAPTTSKEMVERGADIFEALCRAYMKALVTP
jgi:hypothetical protein